MGSLLGVLRISTGVSIPLASKCVGEVRSAVSFVASAGHAACAVESC